MRAGLLAGILSGAVGVPGPPMIVYGAFMSASGFWSDAEMKATFTAFVGTLMLYRLGTLTYTGAVTTPLMIEAAIAVPMVFLGAWIGVYIFDHPLRIGSSPHSTRRGMHGEIVTPTIAER